nr:15327_t:CDS:2 [Entrophospora candida]CAG8439693.1 13214_t:CDS:2 [Entrophospora candida]
MYFPKNAISVYQDEVNSIETDEENLNHNECDFEDFEENVIGNNNSKGCDFESILSLWKKMLEAEKYGFS